MRLVKRIGQFSALSVDLGTEITRSPLDIGLRANPIHLPVINSACATNGPLSNQPPPLVVR